jgi:acyl-CoA synthetase (AMP-forming)/AMP-acid ligase II
VLVARPHSALDAGALAAYCGSHLADYKIPREFRFDAGPLERNASGKIMKAQVRKRLYGG